MSNFTKWNLAYKIFQTLPIFSKFLWNLIFIVLGSHEKFSLVLLHITNYIYSTWKMWKKDAMMMELFWYKVFVHWKLKLFNFRMDSVLSSIKLRCKPNALGVRDSIMQLHFSLVKDALLKWNDFFLAFKASLPASFSKSVHHFLRKAPLLHRGISQQTAGLFPSKL